MPTQPRFLTYDEYNEKLRNLKTMKDVNAFVKDLVSPVLQQRVCQRFCVHSS